MNERNVLHTETPSDHERALREGVITAVRFAGRIANTSSGVTGHPELPVEALDQLKQLATGEVLSADQMRLTAGDSYAPIFVQQGLCLRLPDGSVVMPGDIGKVITDAMESGDLGNQEPHRTQGASVDMTTSNTGLPMSLRTTHGEREYQLAKRQGKLKRLADEPSVEEWEHWRKIANAFPYSAVFSKHDMLIPRREIANVSDLSLVEVQELFSILSNEINDEYDCWFINTRKRRSVLGHLHVHLAALLDSVYNQHTVSSEKAVSVSIKE